MKLAALVVLLVVLASGCGSSANLENTRLTLTALNPSVGMAVFHLDCQPGGGDVADPAAACAALAHNPKLVTSPTPLTCGGGPSSWFDVTISGRLGGKPLHRTFSTCWTQQSATLGALGVGRSLTGHIRAGRRGVLTAGASRAFPAGALRPGDFLACALRGHDLRLGVNDRVGSMGTVGSKTLIITASRHADGSITGRCDARA